MAKVTFISSNPNKMREVRQLFAGYDLETKSLDLPPEIQSFDLAEVVRAKARAAYGLHGGPVLVEDVALHVRALGGFPGPYVKSWEKGPGYARAVLIATALRDHEATAACTVGYMDRDGLFITTGGVDGLLVPARGKSEFRFDPFFLPYSHRKTFAEMGLEAKNRCSHRALAFKEMKEYLLSQKLISKIG